MSYRNVAMFTKDGALKRLVTGPSNQVELNIKNHKGPWADIDLEISDLSYVPSMQQLKDRGELKNG